MSNIDYKILGDQVAAAAELGFDPSFLVTAAAEAAKGGIAAKQASDAENKAKGDAVAALARSIAADVAWANAEAVSDLANQSKDPQRVAASSALLSSAMQAAMTAGAALSSDGAAKRCEAAQKASQDAASASLAVPHDMTKAAQQRAWAKVASQCAGGTSGGGDKSLAHGGGGDAGGASFFMRKHWGIPTWGYFVGVPVVTTGVVLLVRALIHRRK